MNESITSTTKTFTGSASLAALGIKVERTEVVRADYTTGANCAKDDQGSAQRQTL